jgi:glycosyltransferase involved in cell wall biosynthesis
MTDLPKISIIVPTRNRAGYLKRSLDKIIEADYPALEIIVMDSGSTDGTVELLRTYGNRISKWVSERDGGEYAALNRGIALATGDYILHFTDDDVLIPSSLASVGKFAARNGEFDIIFCQVNLWIEIDGVACRYGVTRYLDAEALKSSRYFRRSSGPPTQGAFVKRDLYGRIGLHATDYVISDYEFWARAIKHGAKCALSPIVVADYHYTGANQVMTRARQIRQDHVRIASTYGSRSDAIAVRCTQILMGWLTEMAHAMGVHPLRWWFHRKAKRNRIAGQKRDSSL